MVGIYLRIIKTISKTEIDYTDINHISIIGRPDKLHEQTKCEIIDRASSTVLPTLFEGRVY